MVFEQLMDPIMGPLISLHPLLAVAIVALFVSIIVTPGAQQALYITLTSTLNPGDEVLISNPSYMQYYPTVRFLSGKPSPFHLGYEGSHIDIKELESKISDKTKIILLCNPNNPTGTSFSREAILDVIENSGALVVVDEAYSEFSGKTFLPLIGKYENLILLRTFSKAFGLAGLRTGYMIAGSDVINEIMKVKMVYNINSLSQKIALILLEHRKEIALYLEKILQERKRLMQGLDEISGIEAFPSDANFILFRADPDAEVVFSKLLENGILIRNLNEPGLLKNCLRVTVGKPGENDAFLGVLRNFYE